MIKYKHLLFLSIFLNGVGLLFGYKVGGRLAVSNLFQVFSIVVSIPIILKYFRFKDYLFLTWSITFMCISAFFVSLIYSYEFSATHFIFFNMAFLTLQTIYVVNRRENVKGVFEKVVKILIVPSFLYLLFVGLIDVVVKGAPYSYFGFDDKSHAVIVLCFYAFMSLKLIKSNFKFIISAAFMILAFLTGSRLVFIFTCFYILPLISNLFSLKKARTLLNFYFRVIMGLFIVFGVTAFIINNSDSFKVLERISSQNSNSSESTSAHMELIKYGARLKIDNPANFIFGVTPGGFSPVLARSDINFAEFSLIDPKGYEKILTGEAPMHSTHMSIITEFSLFHAFYYLLLLGYILKGLLKNKLKTETLFYISLLICTTFYSSSNELFFYFIVSHLIVISTKSDISSIKKLARKNASRKKHISVA